ncbi:MAG: dTDP-glucose 4,6-dehydratase, partial [Firmicutes bacterium]|nr:dTDP-glucose 4,6-dehydratase [Bacillota bacterium]
MRVLVTGGCGFIGSNFIRYAIRERGWEIINMDKLTYAGNPSNLSDIEGDERYRFVRGDIADRDLVSSLFKDNLDAVVNFAAETHVDRSILDPSPFIETNVKGTQVLLEAARVHDIERFVHISTDEVYGSTPEGRFTEDSPLMPNSPYAASKAAADLLCRAYHKTYGVPVMVTRSSNNYGPYQFPEKLIPLMINNAISGREMPVYGEGAQVRDWLYVEDN